MQLSAYATCSKLEDASTKVRKKLTVDGGLELLFISIDIGIVLGVVNTAVATVNHSLAHFVGAHAGKVSAACLDRIISMHFGG